MMRWSGIAPEPTTQTADEIRPEFIERHGQQRARKLTQREGTVHPLVVAILQQAATAKNARLTGELKWHGENVSHAAVSDSWWCIGCQRKHHSNNMIVGYSILAGMTYEYCHVARHRSKMEDVAMPAERQKQVREWYDKLPPVAPDQPEANAPAGNVATTAANWRATALQAQAVTQDDDLTVTDVKAYGVVQLDMSAPDFIGCINKTNNTGELSAVPHAIHRVYRWRQHNRRRLNLRSTDWTHVIMVYDSECARTNSDATVTDPLPDANTTVVRMIRRLIAEMPNYRIRVHWVKVRGHSDHKGNDAADKAATWGQNGGSKNVENMMECMEWLKELTREEQEEEGRTMETSG